MLMFVSFYMGTVVEYGRVESLVVHGAWKKDDCVGAAAWCYDQYSHGCSCFPALSSTQVEALAVWRLLDGQNRLGLDACKF